MTTAKRIFAVALAIIITMGVSGCMFFRSNESIMLAHMREKYGQEFISLGMGNSGHFGGGDPVMYCYLKGGDPETDEVRVIMYSKTSIHDTYFDILIREDFEAEVLDTLSELPLLTKVYLDSSSSPSERFDGTNTYADLKQWISEGNSVQFDIRIAVCVDGTDKSEKEAYAKQMFDKLEHSGFYGEVDVLFYPSEAFEKNMRSLTVRRELASQYHDEYAIFSKNIK